MVRKYIGAILFTILVGTYAVSAQERIVYIDGSKYIIHNVAKGETFYSLSKRYAVSIDDIVAANPVTADGLKTDQILKIPYTDTAQATDEKRSKKDFDIHVVRRGETLYSISRKYSLSVDTLIADNDNINPSGLAVGQKLYIRKSEIGHTDEATASQQLVARSEAMSKVADGDVCYHVVHTNETAESIAVRFGISEAELLALNKMKNPSEMQTGLIVKIPKPATETSEGEVAEEESYEPLNFRTLLPGERAQISLLLPLGANGTPVQNYMDFYCGFLLGLDEVRMCGYSADVRLYNTAHDYNRINELVADGSLEGSDLIVGPVYEDELFPVAKYAEQHSIPVVSPLANISATESRAVFQMSPDVTTKYDKVRNLFDGSKRVVLISSEGNDSEFEAEILQMLGTTPYARHKYIYEHPSEIERREKAAAARSVEAAPSPSDLSPLLLEDKESVFVVLSDNETDVDRILAALASANISLTARSRSVAPFVVLGNSKWHRYRNIDHAIFFTDNVIMLSTYHARRDDDKVKEFDSRYVKAFDAVPSLYSYRGYDAAVIFTQALYNGIGNGLVGARFTPLQTPYRFDAPDGNAIRTNREWVRINYRSNFTTTTE